MSATIADRGQTQSTSTDDLHLTAVQVAFNQGRPKGRLKLVVALNNEDYTVKVNENGDLQWSGSIHCSLPSTARVCIYHRRRLRWEEFASLEVPLSLDILLASDTVQLSRTYATVTITDSERLAAVTFTISESSAFLRIKAAREQEEKAAAEKAARERAEKAAREEAERAAREQAEKKKSILNKLKKFQSLLAILESIHFSVGAAIPALNSLAQVCERRNSHFEEVVKFVDLFEPFLSIRAHVKHLAQNAETQRAIGTMGDLIVEGFGHISSPMTSSLLDTSSLSLEMPHSDPINQGNVPGKEDNRRLSELREGFSRAKAAFDCSIELEFLRKKLLKHQEVHSQCGAGDICLDGTRVDLLKRIMNWIDEDRTDTKPNVFWLRGRTGVGKTTVANTIAHAAQDRGYLVSSLTCRQDDTNMSSPSSLLSTLAYHFSQQHESYRNTLYQLLRTRSRDSDIIATTDPSVLLDILFKDPLKKTVNPERIHVVIINALGNIGLYNEGTTLAQCILTLSSLVRWIKVFVTCQDEPSIRDTFASGVCTQCDIDEEKDVDHDIKLYIKWQASRLDGVQLSDADVGRLAGRAGGLFIWCSTLFRYSSQHRVPQEYLQTFISDEKGIDPWDGLYQLYDTILESAAETLQDASFMRAVLATVGVASSNRSLSAKAIAVFSHDHDLHITRDEEHVHAVIELLHAALCVDKSKNAVIRAYHSSFYDYLRQKAMGGALGWERYEDVHGRMFRGCIRILNAQLRFNMCKIEMPVLNEDVADLAQRVAENMSEELQYSSLFWSAHLSSSALTTSDAAPGVSSLLCSKKLLFWLECLSLQGSLSRSLLAFEICTRFFHGFFDILVASNNARRAVDYFFKAMDSVSHIYLSSLLWLPRNSRTSRDLELARLRPLQLIENRQEDWEVVVWKKSEDRELYSVVFSPDGKYVASGAGDGVVRVRNARTGALEREISGRGMPISSLAYSPDGSLIASGSSDNTVRVWDVKSGKEVFGPLTGHTSSVNSVAFSPDGQFIASSSHDGTVRVWNARTGLRSGKPLRGHRGWVLDLAYSPDGMHLASGGYDCDIRVWSTVTHKETVRISRGHQRGIQSVAFSPDGHTIISGSRDYTLRRWDARTGEAIGEALRGHTGSVWSVMYTSDGFFILSSSEDRTIRMWDAITGAPVGECLCGHQGWIRSVSCSPDGLLIASASDDMTIRVWDAHTDSKTPDQVRRGHRRGMIAVAWSPNGRHISTGSADRSICLWDAGTGAAIREPLRGHGAPVRSVVFSPDGLFIVSGSDDNTVCIWDTQTGNPIGKPLHGHSNKVWSVACSPNGRRIASASFDGTVRLWDAQTRTLIGEPLQIGDRAVSVAFSPDGRSLACGTRRLLQIWDVSSNASLKMTLRRHFNWVISVAFSPDGRLIASGSDDKTVRLWDAQTGKPRGSPLTGHTGTVYCVAFSPNGRLIASCSNDRTVRLWDTRTGLALGDPLRLRRHSYWVRSVAFSPDGRSLASVGDDGKTYVYDVPSADPSLAKLDTRWSTCCSRIDVEDGWVKDGDTLLLWVPPPHRPVLRVGARVMIGRDEAVAARVDVETLFRYSGRNWVNILSDA